MDYLVSVRLMTYNHAQYIADAMDSILMQNVNFPVEVVIGDDFSKDGTLDIIKEYEGTQNIHIKILERERGGVYWQNRREKGRSYNFFNIIDNCNGKYVALLDGDDCWTDPLKLQKQVEFMEENEDYSLIVGGFKSVNIETGEEKKIIRTTNSLKCKNGYTFTYEDFTQGWITKTLTALFRKSLVNDLNYSNFEWFRDVHLFYHVLQKGYGFYLTEVLGEYRIHKNGVFSLEPKSKKVIKHYYVYKEIYEEYKGEALRKKLLGSIKSIFRSRVNLSNIDLSYYSLLKEAVLLVRDSTELLALTKSLIPLINKYQLRNKNK